MTTRREFLGALALPAVVCGGTWEADAGLVREIASASGSAEDLAGDEDFWALVQEAFTQDRSVINLNNGGVSPSPRVVQEAMRRHLEFSNTSPPPYGMWRVLEPQREGVRARLARHWGVGAEEVALTRNASESLQICQLGFDLEPGDEVLTSTHDYPRMITTFRQRERREGIVLRQCSIPVPCEDEGAVVRAFAEGITERTRLILMCHVVNITGQILPVRAVVEMASARGIPVIVDGAHALGHIAFRLPDLGCSYYGVSLHKWLCAPHGTGLLYVRRDRIGDLWPMMAAGEERREDIRKFEEIGTHPAANYLAIGEALTLHQAIGDGRKEARLRYLKDRWAKALVGMSERFRLHTSLDRRFSCGIGTVQVEGVDSGDLASWLWTRHRILVTAIRHEDFEGIRVTPNVYTTLEEIDRFVEAMAEAERDGVGVDD